jgi:hypothetical protein
MSQTTQCPTCGVVLTLPPGAEEKRLKCPKCGGRFRSAPGGVGRPESSAAGGRPASTITLKARPSEPGVPVADHDLRDTFAPELLFGEDREKPPEPKPARPGPPASAPAGGIADAAGLFAEDEPTRPRKRGPTAEDRSRARRCPTCGSVVPAGMSLCNRCGLDLDTGQRTVLEEILEDAPPPPPPAGPPLPISVLGGTVLVASLALAVVSLVQSVQPESPRAVYLLLAGIGGFGIYASVQFLRLRSARLMLVALLLGALLDIGGLIVLPIYRANQAAPGTGVVAPVPLADQDLPQFENVANRLDVRKIQWGITLLLVDAGAMIVLMSPPVRRHFERPPTRPTLSLAGF